MSTSALEGTYGALPDVLEARLPESRATSSPEVREIRAYEEMAELAFRSVDRPVTLTLLCDLQRIIAEAMQEPPADPGRVRTHQVMIGPRGVPIGEARFVPPPPGDQLQAGLDDWRDWVCSPHPWPAIVSTALSHYQFETLHPFGDANGRVGRMLIVYELMRAGVLAAPYLTISSWFLKHRTSYQDHLFRISQTGDWNPWLQFFCAGLTEQAAQHLAVAQRLFDWSTEVIAELHQRGWGGTIIRLAEDLIDWPVVTQRWVADTYGVSVPTAKSAIDRLVAIGVLTVLTGEAYRKVYGASDVIRIVESL